MLNVNIKESEWPEWANYVAKDSDQRIVYFEFEPYPNFDKGYWVVNSGRYEYGKTLAGEGSDWTQTLTNRKDGKGEPERKHSHYYKDVRHLEFIDVYRVMELYEVTDPCLQHAGKKILVSGKRGIKDQRKDVQEAIDTLQRWIEMQDENERQETRQ